MQEKDKKEESYTKIMEYEQHVHEKNQQRIQIGIKVLLIIPLLFLAVMFKLDSSKVVFLVLWIVSLFGIAFYLIGVEYMDYQLQIKLREFGIREDEPIQGLINEDSAVERIITNAGLLDDSRPSRFKALTQKPENDQAEEIKNETVIEEKTENTYDAGKTTDTDNSQILTDAEEELVQSIRKYINVVNEQAKQNGTEVDMEQTMKVIGEVSKRSPQDFAAMRKARAIEKHEKE